MPDDRELKRMANHLEVLNDEVGKACTKCLEAKPLTEFHKDCKRKDGLQCWCKGCVSKYNRERYAGCRQEINARNREYYVGHREEASTRNHKNYMKNRIDLTLRQLYDITLADYDVMLEAQGNGCAICGRTPEEDGKRLAVDHDHENGKVRGLLCSWCNRGIGLLQDSPVLLRSAANYIGGRH